jgi:4-amino-4-deoxy-L-arabinose transferase-like glycosyltransferase
VQGTSIWERPAGLSERRAFGLVVGLTLVAAALRLYHLGHRSLWLDEAICYWASQADPAQIPYVNGSVRATPPLYTFLIHAMSGFGDSEAWLRAPAWLAGVAAVPASYVLGRRFLSAGAATFVALLLTFAARHVDLSQRVSEYALALLLATLVCLAFARFIESPGARAGFWLALLIPLGAAVHYGLAVLVLGLDLAFLIELRRARAPRRAVALWLAIHLPLLLVLATVLAFDGLGIATQLRSGGYGRDGYLEQAYWDGSLDSLARLGLSHTWQVFDFAHPMGELLLLLVALGLLGTWRERKGRRAATMLLAVFGVTLVAGLAGLYPYSARRHQYFLLPMIYVLAGLGFAYLTRLGPAPKARLVTLVLVALVALGGLRHSLHWLRTTEPEHLRPLADALAAARRPGDGLYVYSWAIPVFRYYEQRRDAAASAQLREGLAEWLPAALRDSDHSARDAAALDATLAASKRSWLVFSHCQGTRCEPLVRRAAGRAELESVATGTDATLYLARARSGEAPSSKTGAD